MISYQRLKKFMTMSNAVLKHPFVEEAFSGKRIHVIAPASGVPSHELEALKQLLQPFDVRCPESLITFDCLFHASSDEQRFRHLVNALTDDNESSIIWALRGGYGSARLLDRLKAIPRPAKPKLLIGCSDITALHLFLTQKWGWSTLHGSGLAKLLDLDADVANFIRIAEIINKHVNHQVFSPLVPLNLAAKQAGLISGHVQGGNLTLLENSIGTFWQVETAGSILFLEEVGEKGYRIDRSLYHLKQAGLFQSVKAIVLGQFLGPDETGIHYALQRFADEMHLPIYQSTQFGHGPVNYPLQYGAGGEILVCDAEPTTLTLYL